MAISFRDKSKGHWGADNEVPNHDQIQIGCLQRIADATEVMAQNYVRLQNEAEKYERWYRLERDQKEALERSIRTHKANYTRLKNKSLSAPVCERCHRQMTAQKFENKITWWTCESCADEQDSKLYHLPTCGTSFRGCDPNCPKELNEKLREQI